MTLKAKIEAVLFLTDHPLRAAAIAKIVNASVEAVQQALLALIQEYESRESGLEISQRDGYIIEVKPEHSQLMNEFAPIEMPSGLLRTLSVIAIKQPVIQSEIIKIRGGGAYDHIKELVQRELVNKKDDGRSPILSTTRHFQEYFRLSQDGEFLRKYVRKQEKLSATKDDKTSSENNLLESKQALNETLADTSESIFIKPAQELTGTPTTLLPDETN